MASRRLSNINKVKKTLLLLVNSKPSVVKKILKNADKSLIKALSEVALNMLNGAVSLSTSQKAKLRRFKKPMRDLTTTPQTKLLAKRKIIQRGGFISTMLGIALPLLIKGVSSLVGIIRKKKRTKGRPRKSNHTHTRTHTRTYARTQRGRHGDETGVDR